MRRLAVLTAVFAAVSAFILVQGIRRSNGGYAHPRGPELYHAGASNFQLREYEAARSYLQDFLAHYDVDDGWRRTALDMLSRIDE